MTWRNLATAWVLCAVLAGCASLGLAPAKNFSARLAYGYSQYTAVNNTIASSLDLKRISSKDARDLRVTARKGRDILNGAKLAYDAGDITNAENRLVLAITVLDALALAMDKQGAQP